MLPFLLKCVIDDLQRNHRSYNGCNEHYSYITIIFFIRYCNKSYLNWCGYDINARRFLFVKIKIREAETER